jgi:hypothetical protein
MRSPCVDALGTGLLRPFLLLYGMTVLRLSAPVTGIAMTAGVVVGCGLAGRRGACEYEIKTLGRQARERRPVSRT